MSQSHVWILKSKLFEDNPRFVVLTYADAETMVHKLNTPGTGFGAEYEAFAIPVGKAYDADCLCETDTKRYCNEGRGPDLATGKHV